MYSHIPFVILIKWLIKKIEKLKPNLLGGFVIKMKNQDIKVLLVFLSVGILTVSCATSSPYIDIRYQLPTPSEQLKSKAVFLEFKDIRTDKAFFGGSAKKYFKHFSGYFTLYIARENMLDEMVGGHNVESLFKKALTTRLETIGIDVMTVQKGDVPVLELVLEKFYLDYKFREWVTDISLQAKLIKDKTTATDKAGVTGKRTKKFGYGNVEKFLGEIFTDSLNKLDIVKLFQKVGL
jgi:hypothetical protein